MTSSLKTRDTTDSSKTALLTSSRRHGVTPSRVAVDAPASRFARSAAFALCAMLAGCVMPPREPDYSATWPEPPPDETSGNGAIYQAGHEVALFENSVARRVGDTLTIRLNERTNASKSSSTTTKKSTDIDLPGPTIAGRPVTVNGVPILETSVENEAEFDGQGDSRQSNRLEGEVTVTVAQRLPNGNLLIRGQKWIAINQGKEYVRIQGIVRPIDIDPDNSISSLKVADAVISYGGKGALADASSPGLLSRFFNAKWLPF
jgi:flagellar L-ring protein FlgH